MVVVFVGIALFHGEQCLRQQKLLHLSPCSICFIDALEDNTTGGFVGRDFVEPLDGFAGIGVDAIGAIFEAMELGEGLLSC